MIVDSFKGRYHFLSNFYAAPFEWEGIEWHNSEAAYQSAKSTDIKVRRKFALTTCPVKAKRTGRNIKLRPDWDAEKVKVMTDIVWCKFSQNPHLQQLLLATGDAYLSEGNNHGDNFWGTCPIGSTRGKNMLGKVLMVVRDEGRLVWNNSGTQE